MNELLKISFFAFFQLISLQLAISQENVIHNQTKSSFSFENQNKNTLSRQKIDSIYNNNQICKKYSEIVKIDTSDWSKYEKVEFDSIPLLKTITANELAKRTLNIKESNYYNKKPFNLIGSYSEAKAKIDTSNLSKIAMEEAQSDVSVYDEGFRSNKLPKAHTDKCNKVYQPANMMNSMADNIKQSLGGKYSNLYLTLDLDFLRMFDVPGNPEMGGDRRIWKGSNESKFAGPDDFKYHRAFKKDSSIYVVLVSQSNYSISDKAKQHGSLKIMGDTTNIFDDSRDFKYLLINLNTKSIENTGYYSQHKDKYHTYSSKSYETSYKLKGNQYYLDKVSNKEYLFLPRINHIEMNETNFQVDSVISEPKKVKKISNSKADPRKENYLDYLINKGLDMKKKKME